MQELIGFVTPSFHFIFILFGASTADSIPVILSSCLFLTGLLWNTNSSLVTLKHLKLDVQTHIAELASQAKFRRETKQQPSHYPHENVVFHVGQLRAEDLRRQRAKKRLEKTYEVVTTLRQAGEKTGVPHDEIVTTRDIEAEYHINKKLVQEYTRRGREGRPHLTPLPVRLKGSGLGGGQLLFRREDIERIVDNPPKPGRTPRKELDPQPSEASDRLVTIAEATQTSGIKLSTLYKYISEGKLTVRGRQTYPAPGGGKILIDMDELNSLPRRSRGRPKKPSPEGDNSY